MERHYRSTHRQLTRSSRPREVVVQHRTLDQALAFCRTNYGAGGDWWITPIQAKQ